MSTCISRAGEYSSHELNAEFACTRCHVLDEEAIFAELARLRAGREELVAMAICTSENAARHAHALSPSSNYMNQIVALVWGRAVDIADGRPTREDPPELGDAPWLALEEELARLRTGVSSLHRVWASVAKAESTPPELAAYYRSHSRAMGLLVEPRHSCSLCEGSPTL